MSTPVGTASRFRDFIESVRSRSDIVDIIGAEVSLAPSGSTLKGLSPFHPEKNPSFVVWPVTQSWYDFSNGGGLGGDVFTYVQEREGVGFKEALLRLAQRAGIKSPDQDDQSFKRELEMDVERREVRRLLGAAAAYYHQILPPEIREETYRGHYGFTDATIDSLKLGWADGRLFAHLRDVHGASREAALKTGLFVVLSGGQVKDFFVNRLVFPYWKRGQVVYFIARKSKYTGTEPWEQAKYKKLLTHSQDHAYVSSTVANDHFYNEDSALKADALLITEGVTDCISAMQAGIGCISPVTTRFREQDVPTLVELARRAKRVVICNDVETNGAGEAGARQTAAALWGAGIEACLAVLPRPDGAEKIDINEFAAAQGPDALRDVLANAKAYPEYLLDCIPKNAPTGEIERLLDPLLAALGSCSSIRVDAILNLIAAKFRLGRKALKARIQELASKNKTDEGGPRKADGAEEKPASTFPQIFTDGQLRNIIAEATAAVTDANNRRIKAAATSPFENQWAPLFVRGSFLVRLVRPADGAAMLSELTEASTLGVLAREANWFETTKDGVNPVFPPKDVARDLLAYPPPAIPAVDSVISTPVFGRDGQLIVSPGLCTLDHLWLEKDTSLDIGNIPQTPTVEQIAAARSIFLDDLLVDFPFVTESDRAHAIAAILLCFMRRLVDGCTPLHLVEATGVGSGKGLCCKLVSIIATGQPADARTLAESEEEARKMITAELLTARPMIMLDNANEKKELASSALASVLTTTRWTDRVLGRSEMVTVSNKALWMLTGNNVRLSKDLARRSVRIRIDPKRDQAWLRRGFKHDPIEQWATEHRGELVRAALLIVQAWIAARMPRSAHRLGSFEDWAAKMGAVLEVAGVNGFLGNLDELYERADVEGEAWRKFTLAWWEAFGPRPMYVSDLARLCDGYDLMADARGDGNAKSQQTRLGQALQAKIDNVFGDLRVVVADEEDRNKRTRYALQWVGEATASLQDREPEIGGGDGEEVNDERRV